MAVQSVTLFVGLMVTPPSSSSPGTEVGALDYTRQPVTFEQTADVPGVMANATAAVWMRALSLWGTIGWLATFTLTGIYEGFGPIVADDGVTPSQVTVGIGDVARFGPGQLRLTASAGYRPSYYGSGGYGRGPYSRAYYDVVTGILHEPFTPPVTVCPGASNWVIEALP